ncbi:vegetative incompatibility het-e-1 [Fusarium albosuccineum]|uniref:Vegetative incompatibility het-e-1 n=1 Tax=Fusarium albosuccineum TaxID=1237068 RepID=A0A8H4P3Z2_9HYPO|nr:vegetative incompatibility het-e-1 [Fusarium albosuccineum]
MNKARRINTVASSPNSERLALVSDDDDKAVQLWDATLGENQEETVDIHGNDIHHIRFSPDGQVIASASGDKMVRLWDAETGACRKILPGTDRVFFSPDNKLLAAASFDQTVRILDMGSFSRKDTITGYWGSISHVAYSPDGKLLASTSLSSNTPQVSLWNAETGTLRQTLEARRKNLTSGVTGCTISAVTFSPDCRIVAALSSRSELWLWDATTGQHQETVSCYGSSRSEIVFSPDSQLIAVPLEDGWASVFNRITCSHSKIHMPELGVNIVAFSPDNRLMAIASTWRSSVWFVYVSRDESLGNLAGLKGSPSKIVFSPDGQSIAVASNDGFVRVWNIWSDISPRAILDHGDTVQALRFSPNGQTIATVSRYRIRIWDVTTGTQRQIMRHDGRTVINIAFSSDELVVSTSPNFESARFWNLRAGMAVETRRYRITPQLQEPRLDAISYGIGLNISSTWITNGYEDLVWIPPEYRPTNWARRDATIFMGCVSGRVIIFHL